ncbi:phosphatase PAP2 family protein [Herbaspirillum sp. LeCh32-8]|uniref:phosphatase PAP2 family protein n=1 Tax=Herbaspirillum sp. LeCh32-8 TaxID=2821356 RepID=UPI001AEB02F6|nr:phosphatase PAP2 family protein [Herbaspirillum sp. LeCh32-8]MBP0596901.1 phosphatase PAP2 family protein [Herbaspirillum sp. LeCh32-8]
MSWWHTITFLGDSAFTVPGACMVALWLGLNGWWRQMLRWLLAFGVAMMIVVITKLLFMGWNITPPLLYNFTGISGHTASATALYLTLAVLLTEGRSAQARGLALTLACALLLSVGLSRFMIKVHSASEVVTGLMVGAAAAWWFCRGLAPERKSLRASLVLVAAAAFMLTGTAGQPAPTQALLKQIAQSLSGRDQVYSRTIPL